MACGGRHVLTKGKQLESWGFGKAASGHSNGVFIWSTVIAFSQTILRVATVGCLERRRVAYSVYTGRRMPPIVFQSTGLLHHYVTTHS